MPTKDRQRQLARAKLERQMARRAAAAKRRRQTQAAVGAGIALLLVVVGAVFLVVNLSGDDDKDTTTEAASGPTCTYQKADSSTGKVKDVGQPPTSNIPDTGTRTVTMTTSVGAIQFTLDQANAPCTSNSLAFLIGKKFYDKTSCHRMTTSGIFVLQCGDPFGDGTGGPAYRYGTENLPTNQHPPYPAGTIAMAKSSEEISVGSQFFIVYKDIPEEALGAEYTVVGKVTKGLDLVEKVAAKGVEGSTGDGKPKQAVNITTVTVSPAAS
ncbi:peptidyl-prolyl cis-trans isomerase B (cyclophilin B) [Cryptosporangium aurantiacum]|uniref:peptidylprolyl isomerase n=2 Tax=Cryptosporangium aurantiacum TaxID=134849 RepID=A0A1M7RFM7_9ACTN|nr:peptidylprolyl isomerase [Cryptosporangium aurantiacum]SHN45050.1 peptidyl-prolyl cis-trans isomerase B (cyclophilin B) [Cryptosporangium aurantiacum]